MSNSTIKDEAKKNARKNILQAIGGSVSPPPTKVAMTIPTAREPSPDDIAQDNKLRVANAVKNLQSELKKEPRPLPPAIKPRKSPTTSPSSSRCQSPAHSKPLPPRPPPPKAPPRLSSLDIVDAPHSPSVSPPASPMRRRSLDLAERPKPPTRRRKKFHTPDNIVEEEDSRGEPSNKIEPDITEETWEVIPPGIKISDEDLRNSNVKHSSPDTVAVVATVEVKVQDATTEVKVQDATTEVKGQIEIPPTGDHLSNEHFEQAVRALSVKKKKPPPLRPTPYSEKTPPLPPKKKKSVYIHAEPETFPAEECDVCEGGDDVEGVGEPLYEAIDKSNLRSRPENLAARQLPSVSSVDSIEDGVERSSTMSTVDRLIMRGGGRNSTTVTRPLSEVSSASSRDLEASFEVIPNRGSNIEDVMSTLRQADEKYQDASIYELIQACSRAMPHVTSTSELPSRIPDFPEEGARNNVIHELYTTEYTYVRSLEVLVDVFKDNLAPLLGEETSHIFANLDNILAFNKGFIALLHSRLKEWTQESCVGDIFIGMFTQSHKSMYGIYCSNYDTAEALVSKLKTKRKDFEQQLQICLANSRVLPGLTFPAYLITPVQRITRYILLLKDIIKRTPADHSDYRNLSKAFETMNELAHYIEAQVSEAQTKKTLASLKNKVHGLADLDSTSRSLIKSGQVYLKNIKKLYQCILFNDLLVFAHGDSRQSKVELQLNLEAVWVEDLEDLDPQTSNEDAIEVYTPERPYAIYTQTRNEKRLWLTKLRESVYHHLLGKDRISPSNTFSTEGRFANFIYSNGMVYAGDFVDAKRHGKGTMTWPNKTLYVGDWVDDERCGEGEFTYNTGDVYRGRWSEDKQNGYGELKFVSNDVYRGYWKDGVRNGDGKILYANGDTFVGHFTVGHIEGRGVLKCQNGVEYNGEWKHSQRQGKGRLRTCTGKVYRGDFHGNLMHGTGIMTFSNKDTYEGRWKNGMRHGNGKLTSRTAGVYEGSWEEDLRHGKGRQTYPNNDVYDGQWENNKRHIKGQLSFSDGSSYDGQFYYDVMQGEGLMEYSKDSKYHGSWLNGLRHGYGSMVFEDKSSYTGDWQYGLRHGQGEYVMADGSVYRGQWTNDKPHGKGTLSIPVSKYNYTGDWVAGMREGRGDEQSQYGQYKGAWKADTKTGYGEERTLVGTIFEGTWDKNRKHGRGVRRMIFGAVDEQIWKTGQLQSDPEKMTAIELPFLNRSDV